MLFTCVAVSDIEAADSCSFWLIKKTVTSTLRFYLVVVASDEFHIERELLKKSVSCSYTYSHIDSLSHNLSHSVLLEHGSTLTQVPTGSGVCTNSPLFPPFSHSLPPSLPRLVFRHAGSSTLGCTRTPPRSSLPSLYISPVRHLHGNLERDLCPWRAV